MQITIYTQFFMVLDSFKDSFQIVSTQEEAKKQVGIRWRVFLNVGDFNLQQISEMWV